MKAISPDEFDPSAHYGCWVTHEGTVIPVGYQDHEDVAISVLQTYHGYNLASTSYGWIALSNQTCEVVCSYINPRPKSVHAAGKILELMETDKKSFAIVRKYDISLRDVIKDMTREMSRWNPSPMIVMHRRRRPASEIPYEHAVVSIGSVDSGVSDTCLGRYSLGSTDPSLADVDGLAGFIVKMMTAVPAVYVQCGSDVDFKLAETIMSDMDRSFRFGFNRDDVILPDSEWIRCLVPHFQRLSSEFTP